MSLILSLETSTDKCSVALHDSGRLISLEEWDEKGGHAKKLPILIDEVMRKSNHQLDDLLAIAVSEGPGSYTGLRIGVSTAKGLAYALDLPLIAVNTLQSLAIQFSGKFEKSAIIAHMDARRMEVYAQPFDSTILPLAEIAPEVLEENSFMEYLSGGPVFFVGNANEKIASMISSVNATFEEADFSARWIGELAFQKYKKKEFENLAYFVPNYLKEFQVLNSRKNPLLL